MYMQNILKMVIKEEESLKPHNYYYTIITLHTFQNILSPF